MISRKIIKIEIIVNAWLANINTNQTKIAITKILSAIKSKNAPSSDSIAYFLAKYPSK